MYESKSNQILISVITPTFNRVDFLQECIESVQNSATAPLNFEFEHIVSDDGSTDGTAEVMKILTEKYPNLHYLRNEDNRGGSTVLNQAIEASRGEWIFVLDDDDVTFQRTLFNFAKTIEQYGQEHSWFAFDFIRSDKNLKYLVGQDCYGWEFKNVDEWIVAMVRKEHVIQHNTIFKKSLWLGVGKYDETLRNAKDTDLYFRFALHKNTVPKYMPTFSHIHRFHETNISNFSEENIHVPNPVWFDNVMRKYPELKNYLTK